REASITRMGSSLLEASASRTTNDAVAFTTAHDRFDQARRACSLELRMLATLATTGTASCWRPFNASHNNLALASIQRTCMSPVVGMRACLAALWGAID